jgi:hypothetical protein
MKDEGGRMKRMLHCLESFYFILHPSAFILSLSSYQQFEHHLCVDWRSRELYSAEAGRRRATSRSSSLSSVHERKRPSPQRGHLPLFVMFIIHPCLRSKVAGLNDCRG